MNSGERTSGRPTPDKDLASRFEILNGLLNTLTDVLDIREVFDHVSQVVQRVLPHDLMGVVEISEGGDRVRLYVGAGLGKPAPTYEVAVPETLKTLIQTWDARIISDYQSHPLAKGSPPLIAGMRTALADPSFRNRGYTASEIRSDANVTAGTFRAKLKFIHDCVAIF